jgi:hypothetical protein
MNRKRAVVTIVTLVGLIGGWLIFRRSPVASLAGGAPSTVTALVTTQPIHQQMMAETLTALGEVTTGKVVAISYRRSDEGGLEERPSDVRRPIPCVNEVRLRVGGLNCERGGSGRAKGGRERV